jgi:choline-sulfatase
MPPGTVTYYQRLRDSGYRVGCVGKLDLAKPYRNNGWYGDRPWTCTRGFTRPEECEGKMHAGSSPTPIGPYTRYLADKGLLAAFHEDYRQRQQSGWVEDLRDSVLPAEDFEDAYIGRRAAEWIEWAPEDYPWHLFVSFVGPHDPFDPPAAYGERYREAAMPPPIEDDLTGKPGWVQARGYDLDAATVARTRQQYCAAIELIDDQLGRMLAALEHRGQLDNTWILFASDHGEMLGDHRLYTKSVPYEAALRVPLLMAGPRLARGAVSDALATRAVYHKLTWDEMAQYPDQAPDQEPEPDEPVSLFDEGGE